MKFYRPNYQRNLIKRVYKNKTMHWEYAGMAAHEDNPDFYFVVFKCSHCGALCGSFDDTCYNCGYLSV